MAREIRIEITRARLVSFSVTLKDGMPDVSATIELLTPTGKRVASYSLQTDHWQKDLKFDVPMTALPHIREISNDLERVVIAHCLGSLKQLPPMAVEEGSEDVPF